MDDTFAMADAVLHLDGAGPIGRYHNDGSFWSERVPGVFGRGQLVSVFAYRETWDYQERHDDGDELAFVLTGAVDLLLDEGDGERSVHLGTGEAGVIPAGAWHRFAVGLHSTVLFVTPVPARTRHRKIGGGRAGGTRKMTT